jgi:hypothetical protein
MAIRKRKGPAIELIETRRGCACCEREPRYDVILYDTRIPGDRGQLWFNMRGYIGQLPTPEGGTISIGEKPITAWRREAAKLNREFAALDRAAS